MAGIIGGLIGAISQGISNISNRKHDRKMAELNQQYTQENMALQQEYNLATMAQQNQYQIDQWNRENEYNDPSAVAARYRSAGITPRAAFGQGSASGAGIAGGLSSAPSGGAPSGTGPMGSAHPNSGVGQALSSMDVEGTLTGIYTALTNAKNINADTEGKLIENRHKEASILLDLEQKRANLVKTGVDTEHQRKSLEFLDQQIAESRKRIESIDQQIEESGSRIKKNNADIRYTEEQTNTERLRNDFFKMFGFYPNATWDTALVGLGTKGIGHLAHFFTKQGAEKKLKQPMSPEDEKDLKEFNETKDAKKKRKIAKRIERNIVINNLPL